MLIGLSRLGLVAYSLLREENKVALFLLAESASSGEDCEFLFFLLNFFTLSSFNSSEVTSLCIFRSIMNVLPNLSFILEATSVIARMLQTTERDLAIDTQQRGKVLGHGKGKVEFKEVLVIHRDLIPWFFKDSI